MNEAFIPFTLLRLRCIHNYGKFVFTGEKPLPRRPDPELESHILDAAQKLWKKGGEKALTMRAVARAAKTNTPAVYRRFKDRDDVLRALLERIRRELAVEMDRASSAEEGCERYVEFALNHPHEFELLSQHGYQLLYRSERSARELGQPAPRPGRDVMRRKLYERFGEAPDQHEGLVMALWMLCHGAATLLNAKAIIPADAADARGTFTASVAALLRQRI